MRKRSIRNQTQLALLLLLIALMNVGQKQQNCICNNPEDGEIGAALLHYRLWAEPGFLNLQAGKSDSLRFVCDTLSADGLPVDAWGGLAVTVSKVTQQADGAAVEITAISNPEQYKVEMFSSFYDSGFHESTGTLRTYVKGRLTNMAKLLNLEGGSVKFSQGGEAECTVSVATADPQLAKPWQRQNMTFKGPAIAVQQCLYFPPTQVGKSVTETILIQNKGDQELTVSFSVAQQVSSHYLVPFGAVVAPGGSLSRQVTFSPLLPGSLNGDLVITSNDPKYATVAVSLLGYGVSAPPPA